MKAKKPSTQPQEGADLKTMREHARLDQFELAKRAGVSRNLISMLERGERNFTTKTREKIYRALIEADEEQKKAPSVITTLSTLPQKNQAALPDYFFSGNWFGVWTPEQTIEEQKKLIAGLQKENDLLREQVGTQTKIIELLQDSETIKQALALISRVETLEKDNADLKRLVGLKSEEVHLESEVESRAGKKGK